MPPPAQVDAARNLLYVRGQVPGHKGNYVLVRDAVRKPRATDLPFPTFLGAEPPPATVAKPTHNPYDEYNSAAA